MFDPKLPTASRQHEQVYRAFEWINTVVELSAALLFLIGSLMFFSEDWLGTGIWLFVLGSAAFAVRPVLTLVREVRLARIPLSPDQRQAGLSR